VQHCSRLLSRGPAHAGAIAFLKRFPPSWVGVRPVLLVLRDAGLVSCSRRTVGVVEPKRSPRSFSYQETRKPAGQLASGRSIGGVGGRCIKQHPARSCSSRNASCCHARGAPEDDRGGKLTGKGDTRTTDKPLAGALVRADSLGRHPRRRLHEADGRYELVFPEMPVHFALTASHPIALPKTENVASAALQEGGAVLDFQLEPRDRDRIVLEPVRCASSGNDRFEAASTVSSRSAAKAFAIGVIRGAAGAMPSKAA